MTTYDLIVEEDSMNIPEDVLIQCPKCKHVFAAADIEWRYIHSTGDSPEECWGVCPQCKQECDWEVPDVDKIIFAKGPEIATELIMDGYRWRYGTEPPKRFRG